VTAPIIYEVSRNKVYDHQLELVTRITESVMRQERNTARGQLWERLAERAS
jgi:hypothetical protein